MGIETVTAKFVRLRPVCLRLRPSEAMTAPSLATHHHLAFMLLLSPFASLDAQSMDSQLSCAVVSCLRPVTLGLRATTHTELLFAYLTFLGMHDPVSAFAHMSVECVCHVVAVKSAADVFAC